MKKVFVHLGGGAGDLDPRSNYRCGFTELIKKVRSKKLKVGVFPIDEDSWIDVGQLEDYRKQIYKL